MGTEIEAVLLVSGPDLIDLGLRQYWSLV